MLFQQLNLNDAYRIDLEKREDGRGFFARVFCVKEFAEHGLESRWVQMNTSLTRRKGTVRGLHFQRPPKAEVKVVRCLHGSIWDVIVDLRKGSRTFGQWQGVELNDGNRSMLYIPAGFAHGFQTMTDGVEVLYMHSEFYAPGYEGGVRYDDPVLAIEWPLEVADISDRDQQLPFLTE